MKTRNHLFGWIAASLLSVLFVACDGLQTVSEAELEEMEELSLKMAKSMLVETDSLVVDSLSMALNSMPDIVLTEQEIEEGMEWWKNRDGNLPGLYEYQVAFRDFPSGSAPDTCFYYMDIQWNCNYPISNSNWQEYDRMQIQYRRAFGSGTVSGDWKYLGEDAPGEYSYGIVKVNGYQDPMDINATHLPAGPIQVRYRLLHKNFPGKANENADDIEKKYDKDLATDWQAPYYNYRTYNNPYGFDADNLDQLESLTFRITVPYELITTRTFSITINVDDYIVYGSLDGEATYEVTMPKFRKSGHYIIEVVCEGEEWEQSGFAFRQGYYEEYTSDELYFIFGLSEFTDYTVPDTIINKQ